MTKRQAFKIVKKCRLNVSPISPGSTTWQWMSRTERAALKKAGRIVRRAYLIRLVKAMLETPRMPST